MAKPGVKRRVIVSIEPELTRVMYEEAWTYPMPSPNATGSALRTVAEFTDPDTDRAWAMAHLQATSRHRAKDAEEANASL